MKPLGNVSLRSWSAILALALACLVGSTWLGVKVTTDHLLYRDATSAAQNWARLLADTVADLEEIAAGEPPSSASMTLFRWAEKAGQVFRYEIYNTDGYSQLVSEKGVALVNVSVFSKDAVRALKANAPLVDVRTGDGFDRPAFYAQAHVPVLVRGTPVAIVGAFVDQTEKHAIYRNTFLIAALSLCLGAALAFGLPAAAWYSRTQEKQQADRRIRFLAHHDALTTLANRASLIEKLEQALASLPARGDGLAVHFIDLDRFKEVNDSLGHEAGDFLLKTIAERLRDAVRADDVVARLGGDEFVVMQNRAANEAEVQALAARLAQAFVAPMYFKESEIIAGGSIGVAMAPRDGQTSERLLRSADLALYRAKAEGRSCLRFFQPEMDTELQARIELEGVIRDAVHNNRFELHYQPLYEMSKRNLIGFEALVRLRKRDGTLVPPNDFIPVAEEMRLIDKIGAWVMREACAAAATWPEHLTVAVNLSPSQFISSGVSNMVGAVLKGTGLAPRRLELEITETLLLENSADVLAELEALKAMGVAIVMDDFGTGYSSLGYLWRFPFDKIKIDRSFMQGFDTPGRHAETVVKTIIALGRELDMRVTVEGVETSKQADFLQDVDGDQAQGFFFGKPMPASEVGASILADVQKSASRLPLTLVPKLAAG